MAKFGLYTYNISSFGNLKKVKFVYALKGRGKEKGIVAKLGGEFLVNGCFIVPITNDKEMRDVFSLWKVDYKRKLIEVIE